MDIKISVILPTYNTPDNWLRAAVESILKQTYENFELIVIDDCSKKSAESLIESFNDNRIVFYRNEVNLGLIKTLNFGISKASGKYIMRMDSDDISLPERFKMQVNYLECHPDVDVLGTAFEKFPKKQVIKYPADDAEIKNTMLFKHNALCHPSVAIRKSTFERLNLSYCQDDSVCEDYGLWLRNIDNLKFANLETVLLNYRWHKNNISKKKTLTQSIGAQMLMFQAQAKFFGFDSSKVINALQKFKDGKIITSSDILDMNNFINEVKTVLHGGEYEVNRVFYKTFLKKCVHDVEFVKILFSGQVDNILKLTFGDKLLILLNL